MGVTSSEVIERLRSAGEWRDFHELQGECRQGSPEERSVSPERAAGAGIVCRRSRSDGLAAVGEPIDTDVTRPRADLLSTLSMMAASRPASTPRAPHALPAPSDMPHPAHRFFRSGAERRGAMAGVREAHLKPPGPWSRSRRQLRGRGGNASLAPDDTCRTTPGGDGGLTTVSPPHLVTHAESAHCDLQDFPFTRWGTDLGGVDDEEVAGSRLLRGSCCGLLTSRPPCRALLGRRLARSGLLGLGLLGAGLARWHGCLPAASASRSLPLRLETRPPSQLPDRSHLAAHDRWRPSAEPMVERAVCR